MQTSQVTYSRHQSAEQLPDRVITEQLFRIEKPTVDTKNRSVSVTAKHVSYDLSGVLIDDQKIASLPDQKIGAGDLPEVFHACGQYPCGIGNEGMGTCSFLRHRDIIAHEAAYHIHEGTEDKQDPDDTEDVEEHVGKGSPSCLGVS